MIKRESTIPRAIYSAQEERSYRVNVEKLAIYGTLDSLATIKEEQYIGTGAGR